MLEIVNFYAVLASVLAAQVIGMTWYSGVLFGKLWFRLAFPGKRMEDVDTGSKVPYVVSFIASGITALICNYLMNILAIKSLVDMLIVASVTSSFHCALSIIHDSFQHTSFGLFLINGTYDFVLVLAFCLISLLFNLKFCFSF
ncbi:uncharacterized protein LOC134192053 [Corticium candelabrum]|uniref:uncharacterized protein LOC134192053 n=1 Tax=Corticium candelabrum TaxID=121492 RepID=UPI002E267B01|nr:uncharacterized protein LOC134192053 [Corticium candelabrum]